MAYSAFVLLPPETDANGAKLAGLLSQYFKGSEPLMEMVKTMEDSSVVHYAILLRWHDWRMQAALNTDPNILESSREIAQKHGQARADFDRISSCDKRIEVLCEPDPSMNHFNDYMLVLQALEEIPGAVLFDPQAECFI
jgi:hypothetical protein